MAEQSTLSDGSKRNFLGEVSDTDMISSSSTTNHPTSLKFKGVVTQSNGTWGAQIYSNNNRIWLGTFKSENEAAMAYDSAAILLCNGQSQQRNFPWTNITVQEPKFQSQFSEEAVLDMIRDRSYNARFSEFLRSQEQEGDSRQFFGTGMKITYLFEKELTPSDVGKLGRLVIPKRYAVKHFPAIFDDNGKNDQGSSGSIVLKMYDRMMRLWSFRYCYWPSSQSCVFTCGWNAFAKENRLKAGDRIAISSGECNDQKIFVIEVAYSDGAVMDCEEGNANDEAIPGFDSSGNVETGIMDAEIIQVDDDDDGSQAMELFPVSEPEPPLPEAPVAKRAKRGFKLFGVWISAD